MGKPGAQAVRALTPTWIQHADLDCGNAGELENTWRASTGTYYE
jgi:hypothetical protein